MGTLESIQSKMLIFTDNNTIISPLYQPIFYVIYSGTQVSGIQRDFKGNILEPHADLESSKYEAYLPEIAVHKTIVKTSKAKPLAIFNVTDTANGGSLSPLA